MAKATGSALSGQPRARYLAWRLRHPRAAREYDRLPAASKANINTLFHAPGGARHARSAVSQADAVRREDRRTRDRARRSTLRTRALAHWQSVSGRTQIPRFDLLSQAELQKTLSMSWDDLRYKASRQHDEYGNSFGEDDTSPNPYWYHRSIR